MSQEELEDNLFAYMEEEFGVVLEDNSEREIADLICRMYQQCGRGEVMLVREVVEKALKVQRQLDKYNLKSVIQSGDAEMDESSDEDEGDESNMAIKEDDKAPHNSGPHNNNFDSLEEFVRGTLFGRPSKPKKELPPPRQLGEVEPEKPEPELDDDGFAPVVRRGKGKR